MNQDLKKLIESIVINDLASAKKIVNFILEKDTATANAQFKQQMMNKLKSSSAPLQQLPSNIRSMLVVEDTFETFDPERYYDQPEQVALKDFIKSVYKCKPLIEAGIKYVTTALLYGESGTGKTTFGRYLAHSLELPFIYVNFAYCISSYLGSTGKNLADIFTYIKDQECVFMIDELDAVGLNRGGNHEVGEMNRIVLNLMQEMDKLSSGVIVLAATNRLDQVDPALLRRFKIKQQLYPLKSEEQDAFIRRYLTKIKDITDRAVIYDATIQLPKTLLTQSALKDALDNLIVNYFIKWRKED